MTKFPHEDVPSLPVTGERLVPGAEAEALFRQHEVRYLFAGAYVKSKRVLDVACGSGLGTDYLLRSGAESCLGIDVDRQAIDYARARFPNCEFARCEATQMCLADDSVDIVISFETIEHIKDQQTFLAECKRVLKPGGLFICSTPNRTLSRWSETNPFHFQELTVAEFENLIRSTFPQVQSYAQAVTLHPAHVARILVVRVLNHFQLIGPIKRLLRREAPTTLPRTEFAGNFAGSHDDIRPWRASFLRQPMFIIAVARKASI